MASSSLVKQLLTSALSQQASNFETRNGGGESLLLAMEAGNMRPGVKGKEGRL